MAKKALDSCRVVIGKAREFFTQQTSEQISNWDTVKMILFIKVMLNLLEPKSNF